MESRIPEFTKQRMVEKVLNLNEKTDEQVLQEIDKELDRLFYLRSQFTDEPYEYQECRVLKIPIEDLILPTRALNCLKRGGFRYTSEFVGMTSSELAKVGGLGKGMNYDMVVARLEEAGVRIREE